jgi:hypothetical protein
MIGSCSGTHISNQVVVAQREPTGLVILRQGRSAVMFADRDAAMPDQIAMLQTPVPPR